VAFRDGVYRRSSGGEPQFVQVAAPTDEEVRAVFNQIIMRMMKLLKRRGALIEEQGETYLADDADSDQAHALKRLRAAACTYRIAFGPRAGQKVLTLRGTKRSAADFKQNLCANLEGFSLHAAVRCAAHQRKTLERLCRYITRPALANEGLLCNGAGQVALTLKNTYRGGTTHLVMSPLTFMQRLAALVPKEPEPAPAAQAQADKLICAHRPVRASLTHLRKRVFNLDLGVVHSA
jgi:Putative transposase